MQMYYLCDKADNYSRGSSSSSCFRSLARRLDKWTIYWSVSLELTGDLHNIDTTDWNVKVVLHPCRCRFCLSYPVWNDAHFRNVTHIDRDAHCPSTCHVTNLSVLMWAQNVLSLPHSPSQLKKKEKQKRTFVFSVMFCVRMYCTTIKKSKASCKGFCLSCVHTYTAVICTYIHKQPEIDQREKREEKKSILLFCAYYVSICCSIIRQCLFLPFLLEVIYSK